VISEAYQLLSDPEKRYRYDQFGAVGVDEDFVDPTVLFRMLFGNGKFDNIFGDLSFCDMNFTATQEGGFDTAAYEQKQDLRKQKLAHQLIIKLEPFVQGVKDSAIPMVHMYTICS
jgi:DnaJ-class molecular chaperone